MGIKKIRERVCQERRVTEERSQGKEITRSSDSSFAHMLSKVNRCMEREDNESDGEREQIGHKCGEVNYMKKSQDGCFKGEQVMSTNKKGNRCNCEELCYSIVQERGMRRRKEHVPAVTN